MRHTTFRVPSHIWVHLSFRNNRADTRNFSFAANFCSRSTFTKFLSPSSLNFRKCKNLSLCLPLTTFIEGEAVCFFVVRVLTKILKFEITLKLRLSRQNFGYKLLFFQVNASSLYLQESFCENIEFSNNGNFWKQWN